MRTWPIMLSFAVTRKRRLASILVAKLLFSSNKDQRHAEFTGTEKSTLQKIQSEKNKKEPRHLRKQHSCQ
jgi:hypothetical protein